MACGVCGRVCPSADFSIEFGLDLCDPCYDAAVLRKHTEHDSAAERAAVLSTTHIRQQRRAGHWPRPRLAMLD